MKLNDYTNHNANRRSPITARRRNAYLRMLALAGIILLAPSCTTDDDGSMPGDNTQPTPVRLIAGIQQVATPATAGTKGTTPVIPGLTRDLPPQTPAPATRTAPGGTDGTQAVWDESDFIGLFMLPTGGKIPADTLPGAHNVLCEVDPATGELKQLPPFVYDPATGGLKPGVLTPMYYPSTDEAVDFVAYWPYNMTLETDYSSIPPYIQIAGAFDQTTAKKQYEADILYSDNARNIHRSKDPVTLQFRHLMAKLRLDITLGEGFERGEVTKVTLPGMPCLVHFDMRNGSVNKIYPWDPSIDIISCLPLPSPAAGTGATATFTALVPPHEGAKFNGRKITVTVDGEDYTGTIPDTDDYSGNTMYAYPVRVTPQGVTIKAPNDDVLWTDTKPLPQGYDLTVANETELRRFAELVNTGGKLPNGTLAAKAKVLQTANIELTVTQEWTPIGKGGNRFLGSYNGDGHTITGLTITTAPAADAANIAYAGLFGAVGKIILTDGEQGAVLTGINLRKVQIDIPAGSGETNLYVGSIAGFIANSTLSLCSAEGTVKANSGTASVYAGGIAGDSWYNTISRCRAAVETQAASTMLPDGHAFAGEIAGQNNTFSIILSCEAQGSQVTAVASTTARAGGIAGRNSGTGLIAFCRTGANAVKAQNGTNYNYAGGLVGNNDGYLYSCYSRATAEATDGGNNFVGAIVGINNEQDRVQHCYGTGDTGPGTSGLAADPGLGIVYNTSPRPEAIYDVMKGYTGIVESIVSDDGETGYPYATRYDRAAYPAHSIESVRVKWDPGKEVWQRGTNTTYPEINMKYGGDDNAVPQP